jgi:anthranilate phosphoribosyltransferase
MSENRNFTDFLELILENEPLTSEEAEQALQLIIQGDVSVAETAAFLFGMRQKGETIEELTAFVKVMRNAAIPVNVDTDGAVDLCGTGGDGTGTFNISTAAMFVVAGAGIPVLKHGNRSISSKCGSADVLECLGVVPDSDAPKIEECFKQTNMAFMFAPIFHPAMKHVMPARRALGIRTFFNILGPLMNPAGVKRQVIGAYNQETAEKCIEILSQLDTEQAITVHSFDGLDEFTTTDKAYLYRYKAGKSISGTSIDATELGFKRATSSDLLGGDAEKNTEIIQNILTGKATQQQTEIVVLNAAYAILVSGRINDIENAILLAKDSIRSGNARIKLNELIECTHDLSSR